MTTPNKELRARLPELPEPKYLAKLSKDGEWAELVPASDWTASMWAYGLESVYTDTQLRDYAIAALARQEEGREAAPVYYVKHDGTHGEYPAPHSGGEVLLERPARVAGRDFMQGQPVQQLVGRAEAHYNVHYSGATDPRLATPTPQAGEARRFRGIGELERTGYLPEGTAAEREAAPPVATAGQQAAGVSVSEEIGRLAMQLDSAASIGDERHLRVTVANVSEKLLALQSTAAGAAPEGWVMVPREPTPEMLAAVKGWEETILVAEDDHREYPISEDTFAAAYAAMLAAAQQPGAQEKA